MKTKSSRLINITYTTRQCREEKTRGFIRPLSQKTPTDRGACRMIVKAICDENPNNLVTESDIFPSRIETMIYA
jgi:hypothetical protein